MKLKLYSLGLLMFGLTINLNAQKRISVDADSYGQEFTGTGGTCGLYIGHYISMSQANRLEASRMLFEDLGLDYVKEYVDDIPEAQENLYNNISIFMDNAKLYNPDVKFVLCASNLPDELEEKDNEGNPIKGEHDATIPDIFDKIAEYYFKACEGYFLRGHTVEIFEPVNERGYSDGKVTDLFDIAVTKFRAMVADPLINTNNIPMPLIAGPSTWSAASPQVFINGWKADRPNAWANTDIVATHGYQSSTEANYQTSFDLAEGKPFIQSEQTGRIQVDEASGVDVIGEQFPEREYAPSYLPQAEIAKHMIDFFNGGGNAFWAFLTNTTRYDHNAGLIGTPWKGSPGETNIYYGFKHLSSTHPMGAKKVDKDLSYIDTNYFKTVSFRKEGENTVYVHILNMHNTSEQVTVDFKTDGIKSLKVLRTDEFNKFDEIENKTFATPIGEYLISTTPFSVTTVEVELEGTSTTVLQEQTITFNTINDVMEDVADFDLSGTSSSSLPLSYELLEGPANLSGSTISVTGVGLVKVKAIQSGDDSYYPALPVEQSFYVRSNKPNVALNKTATASSQLNGTYIPSKAVDGDIIGDSSRWLTDNSINDFSNDPQWIEIDLGANYEVSALGLYTGFNGYKNPIYDFNFQVWNTITEIWTSAISEGKNHNPSYLKSFPPLVGSKVRLYVDDAPDDFLVRLFEIEVFGTFDSELSATNNVALNKDVTVNYGDGSYTHYNDYVPNNATDGIKSGNTAGRWLFRYDNRPLPTELEIDFVDSFTINGYSMFEDQSSSHYTSEYELLYWNDSAWISIVDKSATNGNAKATHDVINESFSEVTTTKVKFIFNTHTQGATTANAHYIRLYEIEIYGQAFSLSIEDESTNRFTAYPNPVREIVHFKNQNNEPINSVVITDIRGAKVHEYSGNVNEIDVSYLKSGIYFLTINKHTQKKIVKY